jgi:L,D-transpeptidase ErfK/SrfK
LGIQGYLIHGTDVGKSFGIGMNVTHGCVRMYPEDIESLYAAVNVGTPVYIVNEPVKMGWKEGLIYLEVNRPTEDGEDGADKEFVSEAGQQQDIKPEETLSKLIEFANNQNEIDVGHAIQVIERGDGIATQVGNAFSHSPPTIQ